MIQHSERRILRKARNCLLPHGYLFLGTAETTMNLDPAYQPLTHGKAVVYRVSSASTPQYESGRTSLPLRIV